MGKVTTTLFMIGLMVIFAFAAFDSVSAAQSEFMPEECEAAKIWESTREDRIEQEFQRRGIFNTEQKGIHRAEIERVVDERIRLLKDLCAQKKN